MRKRMLSLILIISLLAGLSSCGDSSSEDTTGTPTTTSAPEETKRDDLPDDLDFAGAEIKFLCRDSERTADTAMSLTSPRRMAILSTTRSISATSMFRSGSM